MPLIFWLPGAAEGRRVHAAVENLDIVPTILDYLGVPADGHGFEGESLRPLAEGREPTRRYAFADQGKYRSVDDGRFHLIYDGSRNLPSCSRPQRTRWSSTTCSRPTTRRWRRSPRPSTAGCRRPGRP